LFQEEHGDLAQVQAELSVEGDLDGSLDEQGEVGGEDFLDLYELVEHLKNFLDHVLLVQLQSIQDQGDQVLVLPQYLDGLRGLCNLVDCLDS
jgi:hypothetical protein